MKNFFVSTLFFVTLVTLNIFPSISYSQVGTSGSSSGTSYINTWTKTYTSSNESYTPHDIHPTSDHGYIVAGSMNKTFPFTDGYIAKLDANGGMVWQKQYATGTNIAEEFYSVGITSTGDIIVAGKDGFSPTLFITKTDSTGNVIFSFDLPSVNAYLFTSIAVNKKDDFFVVGTIGNDISVMKFDSAGTILWQKIINLRPTDIGTAVLALNDEGVVVAGRSSHPTLSTGMEIFVTRLDKNGALIWSNNYSKDIANQDFTPYDMDQTPQGKILVVGALEDKNTGAGYRNTLMRLDDSNGSVEWYSTINTDLTTSTSNLKNEAYGVLATQNEGAVITGTVKSADHLWLAEFTAAGNIKWQRDYDADQHTQIGRALSRTSDGGYVVVGRGKAFGTVAALRNSIWAIKTDDLGLSDTCYIVTPESYIQDHFINTKIVTPGISNSSVAPANKNVTVTTGIAANDAQCP